MYEILEAEAPEIEDAIHASAEAIRSDIDRNMRDLRISACSGFSHDIYSGSSLQGYPASIAELTGYVETEGNDEIFNDNLNLIRENRAEEEEHKKHNDEITHEIIGGICIAVSTVAAIGGTVASGGAAAPFIAAGMFSAAVGGINAITKATGDFKVNAAVVSQCFNSGAVRPSSGPAGAIVGEMQDGCLLEFCVNAAPCQRGVDPFVGKYHPQALTQHSVSAGKVDWLSTPELGNCYNVALYWPGALSESERQMYFNGSACYPLTHP